MSWQNNFSSSNNLYLNSPPIMHDGRNYATYRPDELLNQQIIIVKLLTYNLMYYLGLLLITYNLFYIIHILYIH